MLAYLLFVALVPHASAAFVGGARAAVHGARGAPVAMGAHKVVKVGLVGGGTVGGGIVEILSSKAEFVRESLGVDIQVTKIAVSNTNKPRDFAVPTGCEITGDPSSIVDDPEIDLVVEVMGGTTLAKDVVVGAIKAGKHVVTANKALIAQDLPEIEALLTSTNRGREGDEVQFGFEAAVCGGIPIIHALQRDFLGDDVVQLSGIINGCTNYMLSGMAESGKNYGEALQEASKLGYAEADPTLDVGGFDARSKLRILMKLAFGVDVEESEIPCRGITEVSPTDFEYARTLGGTVKLLGVAKLDKAGGERVSAFVAPCFVQNSNTLASINGATNAITVASTSLQSSVFVGQGAGRFPTANSCVSDILAICQGQKSNPFPKLAPPGLKFVNSYSSAFYVRIRYRDGVGIIKRLGEVMAESGVSIYSILQNPIVNRNDAQFVVTTDPVDVSAIKAACVKLEAQDWCLGDTFYMPVV